MPAAVPLAEGEVAASAGAWEMDDDLRAAMGLEAESDELPHRGAIQSAFGAHDISGVRAQTDPEATDAMGAEAFAAGDRVAFDSAQPSLHTAAHEAAHVVQQQRGGAADGGEHEQHADAVADRVVQGESAEDLLGAGPTGGSDGAVVQRKPKGQRGPSGPAPVWRVVAEDTIKNVLRRPVASCDAAGLQARKRELIEIFAALPVYDRRTLHDRLTLVDPDDELAFLFGYRLATPTRQTLIRALVGDPTPLPAPHESIEVDAFLADIADTAIAITEPLVVPTGQVTLDVPVTVKTQHTPPEGHHTELQWHLDDPTGESLGRGTMAWPPTQVAGVQLALGVLVGRTTLLVQVVIDGTVRKMMRRLLVAAPPGGALPNAELTPAIEELAREAFAHPIRPARNGSFENEQIEGLLAPLTTVALPYRAALVARLSTPVPGDDLAHLFYANIPASLRPEVIQALSGSLELAAPSGTADPEVESAIDGAQVAPHPPHLIIGPWMEKADVEVRVTDPQAAETRWGQADPDGATIEALWTVTSPTKEVTEHRTTWTHSRAEGEPLRLSLAVDGTYLIDVRFALGGIVLRKELVEIPVEVAKDATELAAAQAMDPEQITGEREAIRARMANDDGDHNPTDDASRTQDGVVFGALGAAAAGMEAAPESPPPVPADGTRFAPPDWTSGTIFHEPELSTDPTHMRFVCERYRAAGDQFGDHWMPGVLKESLQAYINYLGGLQGRDADLAQARLVFPVLERQLSLLEQERELYTAEFGRRALKLATALLDNSAERIAAARIKMGIEPGNDRAAADIEELAGAASRLLALQVAVEREEERRTIAQERIQAIEYMPMEDQNAFGQELVELDVQLADSTALAETKQKDFELAQGELSMRFPLLAMADAEGDDLVKQKHRYDTGALGKLAEGNVTYIAGKLDDTETNIADARDELDTDSVWSVPDLVALTQQTMGAAPFSFQEQAVRYKLGMIAAGKLVRAVSTAGINLIALLTAWSGLGEAIWAIEGLTMAKDVYDLTKTIQQYQFEKALHGTDYDKAKALSATDPSLFWLAFDIVATLIGGAASIKALKDAGKAFLTVRSARNAVRTATTAEEVVARLAELEKVVVDLKLSASTANKLRKSALEELSKRADDVGDAARKALSGADDVADLGRVADTADDAVDTTDAAADASRTADEITAGLKQQLGDALYTRLVDGGLKDGEITEAIRGLGGVDELERVSALFARADTLLTLRNKLGWRNLRLLSRHMDGPRLLAFVANLDPMKLRFVGRMEDAGVEAFARLDDALKSRFLGLSDAILTKAVNKLPGRMEDLVGSFGRVDDALILRLLDHAHGDHVLGMIRRLDNTALAKFQALSPEHIDELLKRNPFVFDSIGAQTPADQLETFERIAKNDEVYKIPGAATNKVGHPASQHGPFQSDAAMFERATTEGHAASRWESWDALENATNAAKKQVTDPPSILALGKHDHSPINANGWRRIDRETTQAGKLKLINEMLTQPGHRRFLKEKVDIRGLHPPGGKSFGTDGVTITQTDKTLTILQLDDSGTYRVLTAYPEP